MRCKNVKVTFEIPVPINQPDCNGVMYSIEAIRKACEDTENSPIIAYDIDGNEIVIGVAQKVEFYEESGTIYISGVLTHGGTCEQVIIEKNTITSMKITNFGIGK